MLSAGVMLSAGFCHLLADAHRYLLFMGRFPVSNFLAATGYIITLLADQVVQYVSEQQAAHGAKAHSSAASLTDIARNGTYNKVPTAGTELRSGSDGAFSTAVYRDKGHDAESQSLSDANGVAADGGKASASPLARAPGGRNHSHGGADEEQRALLRSQSSGGDCHSSGVVVLLGGRKLSFATAVLLASALCIHSILEGMALGAQQSMRSTEDIMVAIAAHKGLAAYALGASIMESGASSDKFWTVIGCFSLATPIGIFAGYGMSSASSGKSGAALSALASGTFLYVAFMEVIPKELADGKHRFAKMAAFLVGYALMSLLAVWA